ncbi:MAG TPA: TonB family protein [Pseudolabrys sp.]|nr:TonB family protein [Pseudolabrys sp.]
MLIALAMHAGLGGFILLDAQQEPDDSELGAPALAIGIDLASPRTPPTNLPPGPESEASMASQAVTEQRAATVQSDLPKETPVESEEADRLVTRDEVAERAEKAEEVAVEEVKPSDASVALEAMAPPSVEAPVEGPQSVTVDRGTAASRQRARVTWQRELLAHLDRYKRYPAERLQRDAEIIVNLLLDRKGRVVSASVSRSSGFAAFDEAAVAMVQRASPLPAPPPLVADEGLSFQLPVNFRSGRS